MNFRFNLKYFFLFLFLIFLYCEKENTPPVAVLEVDPVWGDSTLIFTFDASGCYDNEDIELSLLVRWDWDNDGIWDTDYSSERKDNHRFSGTGFHTISIEVKDRGGLTDSTSIEVYIRGDNQTSTMTDPRDGREYKTVKLLGKWWMAENLKTGKLIQSNFPQHRNGLIEKYAYDENPDNIEKYGGLYFFDEAMNYKDEPGSQGICPPGWHIPSLNEWLEIGMGAPNKYLNEYYGPGGESFFNLQLSGIYLKKQNYREEYEFGFKNMDRSGSYWTSTQKSETFGTSDGKRTISYSWFIGLLRSEDSRDSYTGFATGRTGDFYQFMHTDPYFHLDYAASIRCVKDE